MEMHKLRTVEAITLLLSVMISHIILNLSTHLLTLTGTSTILNIIYISILTFIMFFIVEKIFKVFPNSDIIDICEFLGGKPLKIIYSIGFVIYSSIISSLMIRIFSESLSLIYFSNVNIELIILTFVIACTILTLLGFKVITRITLIFVPFILISMVIIFFTSASDFVIERALPIFGYGIENTFLTGTSNLFAFSSIIIIFFLKPFIDDNKFKKVGFISIGIFAIYLLISISSLLFLIPSISEINTMLSVYVLARRISLGEFIQRIDALFILVWTISIFSYLAVTMHFSLKSFQKATNIKNCTPMVYSISALIFAISLIPRNISETTFFENVIYRYASLIVVFGFTFLILILAYFKKKYLKNKKEKLQIE